MKIAAISDIHGNIYALMKALEDIDDQKVDKIVCLGDFVGYGPHPNEVIALIKRREIPCIKGNYDVSVVNGAYTYIRNTTINSFSLPWTCSELRTSNKFYLDSPTNQQFIVLENDKLERLAKDVRYSFWEKYDDTHTVIRFATSWATKMGDVEALIDLL